MSERVRTVLVVTAPLRCRAALAALPIEVTASCTADAGRPWPPSPARGSTSS